MNDEDSHEELLEALGRLPAAAREREAVLAEALRAPPAPGEERALAALRALALRRERRFPWLMLAAALALVCFTTWSFWPRAAPPDQLLGGDFELLQPLGEVQGSYAPFRWERAPRAGEVARLTLRYRAPGSEVMMSETIEVERENEWRPTTEQEARWPDEILWSVRIVSAAQSDVAHSAERSARRSR